MISSASVCLYVCWQGYAKLYSADFHKIRWKGGTRTTQYFVGIPDDVMFGLGLCLGVEQGNGVRVRLVTRFNSNSLDMG